MKKAKNILIKIFTVISVGCLIGLFVVLFANVVLRVLADYIPINFKMSWYAEVVEILFAYMVMFSAVVLCCDKEHFKVDLLKTKFGDKPYFYFLEVVTSLIALSFFVLFLIYSTVLVQGATQTMPVLGIPKGFGYLCMPISAAFLCLFTARDVWDNLKIALKKAPIPKSEIN